MKEDLIKAELAAKATRENDFIAKLAAQEKIFNDKLAIKDKERAAERGELETKIQQLEESNKKALQV